VAWYRQYVAPDSKETITLYRPTGPKELELVRDTGWTAWPPRLPGQPIFYPVLNEDCAIQIARDWNAKDPSMGYRGYVTRFQVRTTHLARYDVKKVGSDVHQEHWIPAEELDELNQKIVGLIDVIHEFHGNPDRGDTPPELGSLQASSESSNGLTCGSSWMGRPGWLPTQAPRQSRTCPTQASGSSDYGFAA
jgi:hypothetical protein